MVAWHCGEQYISKTSPPHNRSSYGGAFLRVGRDPVAGLAVVVTLLDPLLDQVAADGVMPVLAALEAEQVATPALDRL